VTSESYPRSSQIVSISSSSPLCVASSSVGSSMTESLRLAPWTAHPKGMPFLSRTIDHFHPSLARSVGFFPVPFGQRIARS
jgi:hypothetical protein